MSMSMRYFLTDKTVIGKLIRLPLRLIPNDTVVPIVMGPLRGKKWIVGSMNHGFWLGTYDRDTQKLLSKHLKPGTTAIDMGANTGFFSMLLADLVGPKGTVVAIEPHKKNISFIKKHLKLNRYKNVTILPVAMSKKKGVAKFKTGKTRVAGHISMDGDLEVSTLGLDEAIEDGILPVPDYIKIDVEGAEYDVLLGAKNTLERYGPMIFLETHGDELHKKCILFLTTIGYKYEETYQYLTGNYQNVLFWKTSGKGLGQ